MQQQTLNMIADDLQARRQKLADLAELNPRQQLSDLLQEVDSALHRFKVGEYGQCEVCLLPVEQDRLLANPLERHCLGCLTPEERRALEQDLETASQVQGAFLPNQELDYSGWDIYYQYKPYGPVSGDHLDLVEKSESGDLFFMFGDVSGKGVSASLLTAQLHTLFRTLIDLDLPLEEMLKRANRLFSDSTLPNFYATLVFGNLRADGSVELLNAGHLAPLLVTKKGRRALLPTGLPIGMFREGSYDRYQFQLEEGDLLYLFTDGLSEARNESGEEFGEARIRGSLDGLHGKPAREIVEGTLNRLAAFGNGTPQADDLTTMAIRRAWCC
jgi:sigma-B regulation protein RsbU (phosphoserine phosphatase)